MEGYTLEIPNKEEEEKEGGSIRTTPYCLKQLVSKTTTISQIYIYPGHFQFIIRKVLRCRMKVFNSSGSFLEMLEILA